uniref:Otopetrin-2 n=1 Tax=Gongylonema pulchrum TaxID=637853 RepID=A0A183ECJ8_9BILA
LVASTTHEPLLNDQIRPGLYSAHYLGDVATYLATAVVEFSLIGAAVMFILWKSIDNGTISCGNDAGSERVKRKHRMRVDCSSSSTGLFAGILFLIVTFISIGVHSVFTQLNNSRSAQLAFGLADLALFATSLSACTIGIYRMRMLQFLRRSHGSAEILDEILLMIGLIGELLFCCTGMLLWITKSDENDDEAGEVYVLIVYVVRLLQVLIQTVFMLVAGRLRAHSLEAKEQKPGKQIVTFLLMANVTLFFFYTFESVNASYCHKNVFGTQYIIAHTVAPLIVLYRFHSSVCLAEIWKHCYSVKTASDRAQSNY